MISKHGKHNHLLHGCTGVRPLFVFIDRNLNTDTERTTY